MMIDKIFPVSEFPLRAGALAPTPDGGRASILFFYEFPMISSEYQKCGISYSCQEDGKIIRLAVKKLTAGYDSGVEFYFGEGDDPSAVTKVAKGELNRLAEGKHNLLELAEILGDADKMSKLKWYQIV